MVRNGFGSSLFVFVFFVADNYCSAFNLSGYLFVAEGENRYKGKYVLITDCDTGFGSAAAIKDGAY